LCSGNNPEPGYEGLDRMKMPRVKYVCDLNKEALPFKENSIDAFFERFSFYEIDDPMKVIEDCWRCLKYDGTITIKEMHFSSHFAYLPYTKNFWSFTALRLFTPLYSRDRGWKWEIVEVDFETGFEESHPGLSRIFKDLVNLNRNAYEKYLSRIFPIFAIKFKLKKVF